LFFQNVTRDHWDAIPKPMLDNTLQSLLIMVGINYWAAFPAKNIRIRWFSLSREQAQFWNELYLKWLGEFFYITHTDFRDLIDFPFDASYEPDPVVKFERPKRSLVLNGAGKDSILSAEILKEAWITFDFFVFSPTPAHKRIAQLTWVKNICVERKYDPWFFRSGSYPSVSTFTFVAVLLAQLLGYDSIVFSNEKSADIGNLNYLWLDVNHQWCKSTEAEKMINEYIQKYITTDIKTFSPLRKYSELEIVSLFVQHKKYLHDFTSCNTYFWLPRFQQIMQKKNYWCCHCPKCVFLFASFSWFLPKKELVSIFWADLYERKNLLPYIKRILGVEWFKPLDCVGEPEEMILAMYYAYKTGEYAGEPAMDLFRQYFPEWYDFWALEKKVFLNREHLQAFMQ
jgi:hypothetical protein